MAGGCAFRRSYVCSFCQGISSLFASGKNKEEDYYSKQFGLFHNYLTAKVPIIQTVSVGRRRAPNYLNFTAVQQGLHPDANSP